MSALRAWAHRLGGLFDKERKDRELAEELEAHLQFHVDDNLRRGMAPAEARRNALLALGGIEQTKEKVRDRRGFPFVESVLQDIRFGLRMLRKSPGFTAVAVLTLALGIGANTAIFSVVDAVLIRPLPFQRPSEIVSLHEGLPKMGYSKMGFSPPDLLVFARAQKSFTDLGFFQDQHVDISSQGEPARVTAARVSSSLFPMLGAQPILGRAFTPAEDVPGRQVAMVSYGLWQSRYGGASTIIGQEIRLDRQPYIIVGVMPRGFVFPLPGPDGVNSSPADVWVPIAFTPAEMQNWGGSYFTSVLGRLRPGVTLDQARGEAESLADVILASYPPVLTTAIRGAQLNVSALPFHEEVVGSVRTLLLVLVAAVAFVLLIACANVATLLLSRASARQREISIRTALGATRLRLVRQMLTESFLLTLAGGSLGLALAVWARNVMIALVPSAVPFPAHLSLNGSVLAFTLGASVFAAILFGLAPAFQVSPSAMQVPLQETGRSATTSRAQRHLRSFFVITEFALALLLLMGSGLLIRSFVNLLETSPGFHPDRLLTLNAPVPAEAYPHAPQVQNFYTELLDRVSTLPGVENAALSNDLPLEAVEYVAFSIEGRADAGRQTPEAVCQSWILGNYFQTMGISLLHGRSFTPEDLFESQQVAIVNMAAARKFWPGQNAIGKRIQWGVKSPWETIVGIVDDVKEGPLSSVVVPHVYRPYLQMDGGLLEADPFADQHAMNLALRSQGDPASLASEVVAQVHSLDPDLAVGRIRTMNEVISASFAAPKFNMALIGTLAGLALFLSAIGVYGILAYAVSQQTHSIGIRMALGAQRRNVMSLVLGEGTKLALLGAGIGSLAALGLTRLMSSLLFGVSPMDPLTLGIAAVVLCIVALAACFIPARRATKVDPMIALRHE